MLTYSDIIDHLVDVMGGAPDDRNQRLIRRATETACRDINEIADWKYYLSPGRVFINAPYTTASGGTLTYVNSTLICTLSTGTLPTWIDQAKVKIGTGIHKIVSRLSNTTFKLDSVSNPGANVSATTDWQIIRSSYVLPVDFIEMFRPINPATKWWSWYMAPQDFMFMERQYGATGTPTYWTVMADPDPLNNKYGRLAMFIYPLPSTDMYVDFLYRRRPRRMFRTGVQETPSYTGTVSGTGGLSALTFSGAALEANMVGSVIRLAIASAVPDGSASLNAYLEEAVIATVGGSNAATIQGTLANTYSGGKFRISDPFDCDPGLFTAVLRGAEYQLSILKTDPPNKQAAAKELYEEAVRQAKENDVRHPLNSSVNMDAAFDLPPYGGNYTTTL